MRKILGLVAVGVLLAGCSSTVANQETWSVAGSVSVPALATEGFFGSQDFSDEAGDSCELADELDGVLPKLENSAVRITDSSGKVLGSAVLTRGELAFGYQGSWQGHDTVRSTDFLSKSRWDRCIYFFRIDDLPLDRDQYFISARGLESKKLEPAEDGSTRVDFTLYRSRGGDVVAVSEGARDKLAPIIIVGY